MKKGPVAYWMSRDQRAQDNWALLFAQKLALDARVPLIVFFTLAPAFLSAAARHYGFMLRGLKELQHTLSAHSIPLILSKGPPEERVPELVNEFGVSALVTDFDPLRIKMRWKESVSEDVAIPFHEVDAHNIVPCRAASSKQEFSARTMRPKIFSKLPEFLTAFPPLKRHPFSAQIKTEDIDPDKILADLKIDHDVKEVDWLRPGEAEAKKTLARFIKEGLNGYGRLRNDPNAGVESNLSPYLHFGQVSAQTAARYVMEAKADKDSKDAFLEELIVRRELSDNFCLYNKDYDNFNGLPEWAKRTLDAHRNDERKYVYSLEEFENAGTHDALWNAAQAEVVKRGKMHGYMRMYWAKKILEWSASPEEAIETAVMLNDKYQLDGRDPNGYAGVAWSIGGLHDRPWAERKIFGKIRYMSYNGCSAKFDVGKYIERIQSL